MGLIQDQDYLYFPKAMWIEKGNVGRNFNASSCLICTKKYLFVVEDDRKQFGKSFLKSATFGAAQLGENTQAFLEAMIKSCDTVEQLEQNTLQLLKDADPKRVAKIAELEKFKIKTGPFGACEYKIDANTKSQFLNGMGGKNKKLLKAFYNQ